MKIVFVLVMMEEEINGFISAKKRLLCVVCSSCHIYFWVPSFLCPKSMLCNYRKWIQTRQKIGAAAEMLVKKNVIDHRHSYVCSFLQVGSRWKMTVLFSKPWAYILHSLLDNAPCAIQNWMINLYLVKHKLSKTTFVFGTPL